MIDAATAKPPAFEAIVVHSFSRFFRDQFQLEFYVRRLAKNGVRLVSITQELGDDPMSNMIRQIMALFDEYQSKENAKHTLRAMKENARQGFWNGSLPPIGYRIVEAAEQHGHRTKKTLEIDPIQAETVRLIFRLAREGDGSSGPMGVKSIAKHLNAAGIRTRDGGRWGVGAVHNVLTRTTYVGRHRFNTRFWKTRERKPEMEVVEMTVPAIIEAAEFEAVQALLKTRSPALTAPRIVSGPTLLTGICFCAGCGKAMTLRTGKGGRYRYYTCSTKARQGETGCLGRTVPMDRLDRVVADHIEQRLLQPKRLEQILSSVLDRREERAERRSAHIAELRKRASEADAKLKRLYDAIENGITDLSDPMLKDRIAELKAIRDQARADAERAEDAIERLGPSITPQALTTFARQARKRMRTDSGGYRRDHLRALAQRVEVDAKEVRIMGSKSVLLRTLVATSSAKTADFGVPSFVPKWRAIRDSNSRGRICKPTSRHRHGAPARSFKAELTSCSGRVRAIAASSLDAIFPYCLRQALRRWSCVALMRGSRFANGNSDETVRLRPFSELLQGAAAWSAFGPGARNCVGQHIQRGGRIAGVPCQESHGHRAASRNRLRRMPSRIECHPRVSRGRHTLPPGSRHGPSACNALVDV
jgi:site-specific DNA recombinase